MSRYRGQVAWKVTFTLAVVLASAGCGSGAASGGESGPEASPEERGSTEPTPVTGTALLQCGQPFHPPVEGVLTVSGQFPASASASEQTIAGTVEVTSREAIRGVAGPRGDVFLVRDGRVVTVPGPQSGVGVRWDLSPGQTQRLPGEAALESCAPGGGPLSPGAYEVYARVVFTADNGAGIDAFGGPWPLQVQ